MKTTDFTTKTPKLENYPPASDVSPVVDHSHIIDDLCTFYLRDFCINLRVDFVGSQNVKSGEKMDVIMMDRSYKNQTDFHKNRGKLDSKKKSKLNILSCQNQGNTVCDRLPRQNFKILS